MQFRSKARTVLLLGESSQKLYFATESLFEDLTGLQCPVDIEKLGEKTVSGNRVAIVRVTDQATCKHVALEVGRPVEMHKPVQNRRYIGKLVAIIRPF